MLQCKAPSQMALLGDSKNGDSKNDRNEEEKPKVIWVEQCIIPFTI